jgi:serine phosphatase RsbU (regulator of sigma subunit)
MPIDQAISPEQMRLVLDVSRMLAITTDLDPLLLRIAEAACAILGCERSSIWLHDPSAHQLWTKVALMTSEIRVPDSAGIVGAAFQANHVLNIADPYNDPRFNPANDKRTGFRTRSILAAPMGDMDGKPLGVIQGINRHDGPFTADHQSLIQLLSDQAGVAIQRYRLQMAAMEIVALRREMDLARRVQDLMIPKNPPSVPGIEAAGWTRSASVTGGDVYDLWQTPDGRLGIFLGDASGHGLAPTLVVSQTRTLVRALSEIENDPLMIMTRINTRLAGDLECGRFVTAFVGFLASDGRLDWCSAGHGPIILRQSREDAIELLDPSVPPLGVLEELPEDRTQPIHLATGGILGVVSDGIFEARNPGGEMFGIQRICQTLDQSAESSPRDAIARVYESVKSWQEKDEPLDDQTIVLVSPR